MKILLWGKPHSKRHLIVVKDQADIKSRISLISEIVTKMAQKHFQTTESTFMTVNPA